MQRSSVVGFRFERPRVPRLYATPAFIHAQPSFSLGGFDDIKIVSVACPSSLKHAFIILLSETDIISVKGSKQPGGIKRIALYTKNPSIFRPCG